MPVVIVSPRYRIVIPREVREPMGIRPGQKFEVLADGRQIVLVPVRDIRELRGFLKGMARTIERDEEDRV